MRCLIVWGKFIRRIMILPIFRNRHMSDTLPNELGPRSNSERYANII